MRVRGGFLFQKAFSLLGVAGQLWAKRSRVNPSAGLQPLPRLRWFAACSLHSALADTFAELKLALLTRAQVWRWCDARDWFGG